MFDDDPIVQAFGNCPIVPKRDEVPSDDDYQLGDGDDREGLLDRPIDLVSFESTEEVAAMNPEQRIEHLLANMYPYRQSMLDIIAECRNPCSFDRISGLVDRAQRSARSVYAVESLLNMLVDAGALEMVTAEAKPYVQTDVGPIVVERDGRTYLEVAKPPEVYWQATSAGRWVLEDNDPMKAVEKLFSERPVFLCAYTELLELCAKDDGASIVTLKEAINGRPDMIEQKKTAQFLLENLSHAGALVYDADCKVWRTNRIGDSALRLLETYESWR